LQSNFSQRTVNYLISFRSWSGKARPFREASLKAPIESGSEPTFLDDPHRIRVWSFLCFITVIFISLPLFAATVTTAQVIYEIAQLEGALKANDPGKIEATKTKLGANLRQVEAVFKKKSPGLYERAQKAFFSANTAPCPAGEPISEANMYPAAIANYVQNNRNVLLDPGDLICCLPRQYRENYEIAHMSKSAQSSDAQGPRILLFNRLFRDRNSRSKLNPLKIVLSINGGQSRLNNAMNIEMMTDEQARREVAYFDIDFKENHIHASGRNPQACMNCHGSIDSKEPGGAKTIFDPNPFWVRFVRGMDACTPAETELMSAIESVSKDALRKNSRYRCPAPEPAEGRHFPKPSSDPATERRISTQELIQLDARLGRKGRSSFTLKAWVCV
jgi:hypothetical protein